MNRAGRSRRGQLDPAGPGQADMRAPACDPPAGDPPAGDPPGPALGGPVPPGTVPSRGTPPDPHGPDPDGPEPPAMPPPTSPSPSTAGMPAVAAGTAFSRTVPGGRLRAAASRPVARHLLLLALYLAVGVAVTWPPVTYPGRHLLPETRDV